MAGFYHKFVNSFVPIICNWNGQSSGIFYRIFFIYYVRKITLPQREYLALVFVDRVKGTSHSEVELIPAASTQPTFQARPMSQQMLCHEFSTYCRYCSLFSLVFVGRDHFEKIYICIYFFPLGERYVISVYLVLCKIPKLRLLKLFIVVWLTTVLYFRLQSPIM